MDRSGPKVKSFDISKRLIAGAWEKVQANGGAPGVDAVSISLFKDDEINNLYKLWLCRVADYAEWMGPRCKSFQLRGSGTGEGLGIIPAP
jgi:hypothetical protein